MRSREEGGGSIEGEERGKRMKGGDGFGRLTGRVRTELKAPHRSGQVPEACRLYTAETHHTRFPRHGPGSLDLDLVGLVLLVQK
jgi:hypothetical protein